MKHNKFIALLLAVLMLAALCACGNDATLTAVHPDIAQPGTEAHAFLSLPIEIKVESAGETAPIYELKTDEATAVEQIERCLGIDLSTAERSTYSLGTQYITKEYSVDIDSENGYWIYSLNDIPPAKAGAAMSDDKAIEIAKSFMEENELWPYGMENFQVADQFGLDENGTYALSFKTVYLYPRVDGKTVLGIYRISIDLSLDGDIQSIYYLATPVGEAKNVAVKSRNELSSDVRSANYSASFSENLTAAKLNDCELGYYADGVAHNGKTYLFPVYVMTGEGTNAAGEKETFDIIIDAQKLTKKVRSFILTFLYIKSFFAVAAVLAALRAAGAFAAAAAPALFHAAHGKHEPHGKNGDYNKLHFKKSPR